MSVCRQPERKTCRARMRHLEQEDERLRAENAKLRTALLLAEPFTRPEITRGPCVDRWVVMREKVGAALSPSEQGASGRGEKGGE